MPSQQAHSLPLALTAMLSFYMEATNWDSGPHVPGQVLTHYTTFPIPKRLSFLGQINFKKTISIYDLEVYSTFFLKVTHGNYKDSNQTIFNTNEVF